MKDKVVHSVSDLKSIFKDNQKILAGGFGLSGSPLTVIDTIAQTDVKGLHVVSNNLGITVLVSISCLSRDRLIKQSVPSSQ